MRRLLCLFRGHQWHSEENYETQGTEQECARCGAHRSTFPGDPRFRQGKPPGGPSSHGLPEGDAGGR
jgi:hypothetical protein